MGVALEVELDAENGWPRDWQPGVACGGWKDMRTGDLARCCPGELAQEDDDVMAEKDVDVSAVNCFFPGLLLFLVFRVLERLLLLLLLLLLPLS